MKIAVVVGARPNFVKAAPLLGAFKKSKFTSVLIHTGQHHDASLSDIFFNDLEIPQPDYNLGISGGTIAEQIGLLIPALNKTFAEIKPDAVLVVGDTNSSLGAAIAAKHSHKFLIHVEAGLRSCDMDMPEEVNRILVDAITDLYFVTEASAIENLKAMGKNKNVYCVGNVMIDALISNLEKIKSVSNPFSQKSYALLTLHRVSNVDNPKQLNHVLEIVNQVAKTISIVFPIHPRTKVRLAERYPLQSGITVIEPQGYLSFQKLMMDAKFVLTDSGGIQDESTYYKIPCLTLRENTERPITVEVGSNTLVDGNRKMILSEISKIMNGTYKKGKIPELWDGHAAERIVQILNSLL